MIVNLRGTHGSGKSTVVRRILDRYEAQPEGQDKKGKPMGYVISLSNGSKLHVVGSYKNDCGGCDGIQPYSEIWPRVVAYAARGHVLFEGALVSSSYGNIGRDSEVYGECFVFAFMDTPLEVCLERIRQRRLARGNDKPVDRRNTENKYNSILRSIPKIRDEFQRRVVMINHRQPVAQVMGLFYNNVQS